MNPYVVVGSPNYAAPLLDFSSLSGKQNQQPQQGQQKNGQQQQQPQPQNPYQAVGAGIRNFGQGLFNYLNPQTAGIGASTPMAPGSVAGANMMLSGLY